MNRWNSPNLGRALRGVERVLFVDESGVPIGDPKQPWFALVGVDVAAADVPALNGHVRDVCRAHLGVIADSPGFELKGGKLLNPDPKRGKHNLSLDGRVALARDLLDLPSFGHGTRLHASAVDTRLWPLRRPPACFDWAMHCKDRALGRPDFFLVLELIGDFCLGLDHDGSSGIEELAFGQRDGVVDRGRVIVDERGRGARFLDSLVRELRVQRPSQFECVTVRLADERLEGDPVPQDSRSHEAIWIADVLAALVRLRHQNDELPDPLARLYDRMRFAFQGRGRFFPREWMSPEMESLLRPVQ